MTDGKPSKLPVFVCTEDMKKSPYFRLIRKIQFPIMKTDKENYCMERTYTLNDIAMMTGFTERTLRTYLKNGLLKGEKTKGIWSFPAASVDAFFQEPYVKEGLRIKRSAAIFDFLADRKKKNPRTCVILDLPCSLSEGNGISDFFCRQMEKARDVQFTFDWDGGMSRVIICGAEEQVRIIMNNYCAALPKTEP